MEEPGFYLLYSLSGQRWKLNSEKKTIIGRGMPTENQSNDLILLPHPTISQIHAEIIFDGSKPAWLFFPVGKNPSLINSVIANQVTSLKDGDRIQIGPFELFFYEKKIVEAGTMEVTNPNRLEDSSQFNQFWEIVTLVILLIASSIFCWLWFQKLL